MISTVEKKKAGKRDRVLGWGWGGEGEMHFKWRDQKRPPRRRHLSRDLKPTAAGLAVKWKIVLDRGNSRWKGPDEAMCLCSGSRQEADVSGVESVRWGVTGEHFTELLQSWVLEGLVGHGGGGT